MKSISPKLFLNDEVQSAMLRNVYRKGADTENFYFIWEEKGDGAIMSRIYREKML